MWFPFAATEAQINYSLLRGRNFLGKTSRQHFLGNFLMSKSDRSAAICYLLVSMTLTSGIYSSAILVDMASPLSKIFHSRFLVAVCGITISHNSEQSGEKFFRLFATFRGAWKCSHIDFAHKCMLEARFFRGQNSSCLQVMLRGLLLLLFALLADTRAPIHTLVRPGCLSASHESSQPPHTYTRAPGVRWVFLFNFPSSMEKWVFV